MSHFSVLVIGDNVEEQLAPFHEFECTGQDDQYVQTVDETEEARKEYESGTERRLRDPEGHLHDPYADRFYRDPTPEEQAKIGPMSGSGGNATLSWTSKDWNDGKGYRAKIHQVPEGWEDVRVPRPQVESFAEWASGWYGRELLDEGDEPDLAGKHKYGYIVVRRQAKPETVALGRFDGLDEDEAAAGGGSAEFRGVEVVAIFDRTNPNKQWDWWVVGGRWNNFLRLKPEVAAQREQLVRDGKPDPWAAGGPSLLMRANGEGGQDFLHTNQAKKGDVDFEAMRDETGEEARQRWQKAAAAIAGRPVPVWKDMVEALGEKPTSEQIEALRNEYHGNPVIQDLRAAEFYFDVEEYAMPEADYVAQARDRAIRTFAVVKDSTWYEKGSMGWWGMVSDEKDEGEWSRQYNNELLDSMPDDTLLTVVDCHI